jgi:hypothetical protein
VSAIVRKSLSVENAGREYGRLSIDVKFLFSVFT